MLAKFKVDDKKILWFCVLFLSERKPLVWLRDLGFIENHIGHCQLLHFYSINSSVCFYRLVRSPSAPSPGLTTEEQQEHC